MLKINPTDEAVAFHFEKASIIFDKVINEKIGKNLLEDHSRKFLKRYKNILIKGKPELLLKIQEKFSRNITLQDFDDLKLCLNKRAYETNFQKNYGVEFLAKLDVDTCIYCNRNYTVQLFDDRARAELDHWFPKETFPILALSFYNLIPSCHSCNHTKLNNSPDGGWLNALRNINHPYLLDKLDVFSFTCYYNSLNKPVAFTKTKSERVKNNIKFNRTNEIYKSQSGKELQDLLDLRYKYSTNYLDILLNKTFNELKMSQDEAYRMIFGIEIKEEDYHKRPFSKFKNDIINELLKIK